MKVQKYDGGTERRAVIAMLTSRDVLARIAGHWEQPGLFPSRWANLVGGWCVEHLKRYDAAPNAAVEGMFAAWASKREAQGDTETVSLVERFLTSLSGEYESYAHEVNPEGVIDEAVGLINRSRYRRHITELQGHLDNGDLEAAEACRRAFKKVELGAGGFTDLLNDPECLRQALEQDDDRALVTYPGDLGKFYGKNLDRDCFVSYLGIEKRGKTFHLLDLSWRAMLQRRRTVYFAAGDMTRPQMLRRYATRAIGRPLRAGAVKWPTKIYRTEKGQVTVDHEKKRYREPASWREAFRKFQEAMERNVRDDVGYLRLVCTPAGQLTVAQIAGMCEGWAADGWAADVVVIDYADLLAPPAGAGKEKRDQINATWIELRALSQSRHCLVVTATQADARAYGKQTVDMSNFSEDKRKLAHVTGMIGLNQTEAEKSLGVMRLNWAVLREEEFHTGRCAYEAQCLAAANPAVRGLI